MTTLEAICLPYWLILLSVRLGLLEDLAAPEGGDWQPTYGKHGNMTITMLSMAIIIIIKVLKSFVDFLGCLVWFGGMPVGLGLEGGDSG